MRKINKDFNDPPAILHSPRCRRQLLTICLEANGGKSTYYKRKEVFDALNHLYHGKCGYCESSINAVATENVEHYRPKAGVNAKDLLPDEVHAGYYWLGNEWTNLLISCPKCNQNGNKGTRFPLRNPGMRVDAHPAFAADGTVDLAANRFSLPPLSREIPLLLNPELISPWLHLTIADTGELKPVRKSAFAEETIKVCDLNRSGLITVRKKVIDATVSSIEKKLLSFTTDDEPLTERQFRRELDDIFSDIIGRLHDKSEYTFVARMIVKHFDRLILSKIDPEFHVLIRDQFNTFLAEI